MIVAEKRIGVASGSQKHPNPSQTVGVAVFRLAVTHRNNIES